MKICCLKKSFGLIALLLLLNSLGANNVIAQDGATLPKAKKELQQVTEKKTSKEQNILLVTLPNAVKLEMVKIKAGTFMMGSSEDELGRENDEIQHQVTLTQDFFIAKFEVTQKQYQAVMGKNPSIFKGKNLPVENVSWEDAMAFCQKLNELTKEQRPAGYVYTLPTEAQWEYACRAGTKASLNHGKNLTNYHGACPNLDEVAWYKRNSGNRTHPVGQKRPNTWGLYDMHGNVWEWCLDRYGSYPNKAINDPTGDKKGSLRVVRGGSWFPNAQGCRSAGRSSGGQTNYFCFLGFRVALALGQ